MKLQNLSIIFAIIVIPVSLVLSSYIGMQIDTIQLQNAYDEVLFTSVHDAIKAYQINTANNPYAIINSSQKRDIEAAINTFMNSFATGLGVSGYGEDYIRPYIPAIMFTLYDGYYIYSPTYNYDENSQKYEHIIKPYITYTQRYKTVNLDVLISYTLDNYITVTGTIGNEYVNKSGYLVNDNVDLNTETLKEQLLIYDESTDTKSIEEYIYIYQGGEKRYYDPNSTDGSGRKWFLYRNGKKAYISLVEETQTEDINAKSYAIESKEFTDWVDSKLGNITLNDLVLEEGVKERNKNNIYIGTNGTNRIFNSNDNNFEAEDSTFNIHKRDMIRISIKENLSSAITNYSEHSGALGTNMSFQMPLLEESQWDQITRNICMMVFVQGLPVGFKTYNNYAIINNPRNKNFISQEGLCFINGDSSTYHRIDCPYLGEDNIQGYREIDFEQTAVEVRNENNDRETMYYFRHRNLPCYYCIVARNYDKVELTEKRQLALRQALGRERQILHY